MQGASPLLYVLRLPGDEAGVHERRGQQQGDADRSQDAGDRHRRRGEGVDQAPGDRGMEQRCMTKQQLCAWRGLCSTGCMTATL